MQIDVNLNQLSEEEFIDFLLNDVNNYLLYKLIPIFQPHQDTKKWAAVLDIVRANMDLYALYHDCDLTKLPPPEPYKSCNYNHSFDVK